MDNWIVAPGGSGREATQALAGVIEAIGSPGFADAALEAVNQAVGAASWSVYRRYPADPDRAPVMHCSASRGVADTTQACFSAYADGLYRRDRSFDALQALPGPRAALLLRMRAEDAPNREHRERIYRRHGLLERLSVAMRDDDASVLAVNLYHHDHQGPFSGRECEAAAELATGLLSAVRRHLALRAATPPSATPRARLAEACPALTVRELDVCERLLRGWSHDGIAADLRLSVATVKTYRSRAFGRLGLHFRSELFARFGAQDAGCRPLG